MFSVFTINLTFPQFILTFPPLLFQCFNDRDKMHVIGNHMLCYNALSYLVTTRLRKQCVCTLQSGSKYFPVVQLLYSMETRTEKR